MSEGQVPEGYKQTEVGIIPEAWNVGKLDDYLSFISYGFTNPMPISDSGIFMITAANISDGKIQYSSARKTTKNAYQTLLTSKSKPREDDVLLTKDGTLGRVALVGQKAICINQSVAVIRPNERVLPQFLKLLLESPEYQQKMLEDAGGTTIRHIYISVVNLMPIAVPPTIEEQRLIAQALSDVDALIAALDKLIAKKRHLKTATMQQLLTGKKRLPGFGKGKGYKQTEVGVIPEDWQVKSIGDTVTLINGRAFKPSDWTSYGLPIIRIQNLNDSLAAFNHYEGEVEERYYVNHGDILFAWSGTKESSFGARMWRGQKAILNQHIFRVVPDGEQLTPEYVLLVLKRFQEDIEKKSHGFKSSFVHVKKSDLENTCLAIPSISEQHEIATVLSDMDAEIAALETRRAKTQAIKQGMMQELLTGKTRLL